jgi:hypothetical protein
MVDSRRVEEESQRRKERGGRTAQSYHSRISDEFEDLEPVSRRRLSTVAPDRETYSLRQMAGQLPMGEQYSQPLFDWPERTDPRATDAQETYETRYDPRHQGPAHGFSTVEGTTLSRGSTYDSGRSGSAATPWSGRSSYSTAPSSIQSISDERGRNHGQEVAPYQSRRSSASQYGTPMQNLSSATQTYTDPRTAGRFTASAKQTVQQRTAPGLALQRHSNPPGWDDTPNFKGFAQDPRDPPGWDDTPNFKEFAQDPQ